MLYGTEMLDVFIWVQSDIAVLILGISHSAIGARVLVEFTLTKSVFYAFYILVKGVLSSGHIDIIHMFGRKQLVTRLELLVVGRGSETRTSGGPSEQCFDSSQCSNPGGVRSTMADPGGK
eukprot:3524699-Pyramimonas_sp.AAC.1